MVQNVVAVACGGLVAFTSYGRIDIAIAIAIAIDIDIDFIPRHGNLQENNGSTKPRQLQPAIWSAASIAALILQRTYPSGIHLHDGDDDT